VVEKLFYVVGRSIIRIGTAKTKGTKKGKESENGLKMGDDERLDHKIKASSDHSVHVSWDRSGREMVQRSREFNQQTALKENRTSVIHCASNTKLNLEKDIFSIDSDLRCEVTCNVRTEKECQLQHLRAPTVSCIKTCARQMDSVTQNMLKSCRHVRQDSMPNTARY